MDDEQLTFGPWLQQRRLQLGLTQEALGKQVGLSTDMIRKIESELRRPSADVAALLARWLKLPEAEHSAFVRFARGETSRPPRDTALPEPDVPAMSSPWREAERQPGNLRRLLAPLIGREGASPFPSATLDELLIDKQTIRRLLLSMMRQLSSIVG